MATSKNKAPESVTYIDQHYKSRTVIYNGKPYPVEKSRITADDPDLIAYLDSRKDFMREPE